MARGTPALSRANALILAASAGVSLLLLKTFPGVHGDGLLATVVALPILVALFHIVDELIPAFRTLQSTRRINQVEFLALIVLGLLATYRQELGILRTDAAIGAGMFCVLVTHVLRQVAALVRASASGARSGTRFTYFLLPLAAYLAILPWSLSQHTPSGDEPYYLLLTHSLAYDHDVELSNNYAAGDSLHFMDRRIEPQPFDPHGADGSIHSRHSSLLPLMLVPAYLLAGSAGVSVVMVLFAAGLCAATYSLLVRLFPSASRGVVLAWAVLAFVSPLPIYSYRVWAEVPAGLGLALACLGLVKLRPEAQVRLNEVLWILLPLVFVVLLKNRFILFAGPLLLAAWWRLPRYRRYGALALAALGALFAAVLIYNQVHFGKPLKYHSLRELNVFRGPSALWWRGAGGLWLDCGFGLTGTSPIWLLLAASAGAAWKRSSPLRWLSLAWLPYLFFLVPRPEWFGALSPPFRYGIAMLPTLAALLVPVLEARDAIARLLTQVLTALSLALLTVWVLAPAWTVNVVDGRSYLLDRLDTQLGADVARLVPSFTRPRTASWAWLLALILLAVLWKWRPRWPVTRPATTFAVCVLAIICAAPVLARHAPSRTIQFEDPYVRHLGGEEFPQRWAKGRDRWFRGWELGPNDAMIAPVIPGGRFVRLRFVVRSVGSSTPMPATFAVAVDGKRVARVRPELHGGWQNAVTDPLPWPDGQAGALRVKVTSGSKTAIVFDRMELNWSDSTPGVPRRWKNPPNRP